MLSDSRLSCEKARTEGLSQSDLGHRDASDLLQADRLSGRLIRG